MDVAAARLDVLSRLVSVGLRCTAKLYCRCAASEVARGWHFIATANKSAVVPTQPKSKSSSADFGLDHVLTVPRDFCSAEDRMGTCTQGGGKVREAHFALPWAKGFNPYGIRTRRSGFA